ncbi:MAG TPA: aminotransferase class I/II-fold pyridoxal phosphate-dependent enzyme [Vicinamibacterales bacterium]|jgi:aspartate/methionine/tyrosine aminotransferase|nr:aminotransferase class I/II-fold pyridoxal phosphate-dependent enzyme [Vicinamibacterales bacterium]
MRPEISAVVESPLVQIATAAEAMPGSIKLCYGESDMPTADFICRAADEAARAGHTFYTHTAGAPELREAIAGKIRELQGVSYRPSEVMATVGGTMAIHVALRALVGRGDNAVIVSPAYSIYVNSVAMSGGESRQVPLAANGARFSLDLDRLERAIDAHTRVLVVNSPSNPTGWMMTADEQRGLAVIAARHGVTVLSDEVYERLTFDTDIAPSMARWIDDKDRLIVVNSFSKTYNMTGWRLGWAQASESIIRTLYKAAEFITSNPASIVQQAGIVALRGGEDYVRDLRTHYAARRAQVTAALGTLPGVVLPEPMGAFYAFPRIAGVTDSTTFAAELLRATGVAIAPGAAFGPSGEGSIRLCFAAGEATITEALERLVGYLSSTGPRRPGL